MIYHVSYWDLVLGPIYILFFYLIILSISRKYYSNDEYLRKILIRGFWLKIFFSILFIVITQFIYGGNDGFMYYEFGTVIDKAISEKLSNISFIFSGSEPFYTYVTDNTIEGVNSVPGYMSSISNQIVSRVSYILGIFCFQNYSVICLFFSLFSYLGIWKMYLVFYKIFTEQKKLITISFLYLPSFLFWSSALLKEPICLLSLGLIVSGFYNIFYFKKYGFWSIIWAFIGCYFLYLVKSYILFSVLGAFGIMFFSTFIKKMNFISKLISSLALILIFTFTVNYVISGLDEDDAESITTEALIEKTQKFKDDYEDMGGAFVDIGDLDPSITGIVKKIPTVIMNVFFRPFPWEAKSILLIISMFESFFFLVLILRALIKTKFFGFFKIVFGNPVYLFCFVFALLLGIIVGLTTFNFGTIIRYKLPCTPFFCMLLLMINVKDLKNMNAKYSNPII
jgi:hypothetical protein